MGDATRTELEAAAFRRLVAHLQNRTDVQNIDLMNLAGFCRNCLGDWYREAAAESGIKLEKDKRGKSFMACRRRNGKGATKRKLRPSNRRNLPNRRRKPTAKNAPPPFPKSCPGLFLLESASERRVWQKMVSLRGS